MAIEFYSSIDVNQNDIHFPVIHKVSSAPSSPSAISGQMYYNTSANTLHYHNGTSWQTVGTSSAAGDIESVVAGTGMTGGATSGDATLNVIGGDGITANANDMAITATQTTLTSITNAALVVGRDAHNQIDFSTDNQIKFKTNNETPVIIMKASGEIEATTFDGALEGNADTATLAATATHVTVTDNASTDENNRVPFIEDTSASGNVGLESDNTFYYNPSSGALSATVFSGEWQGTAVASAYLDADTAHLTTAQTFTGSKTFGTTTKLNFRDANSYIYSPTANDIEVVGTTITLDAGSDIQLEGNTTVTGNLTISGTTTTVNTATLTVQDPLIKLASGNTSGDAVDIGFYGLYDNSGSQDVYTGLTRDASDDKWHLWKLLQAEPTTTVNHSGTGFAVDTLVANLEGNVTGNVTGTTSLATVTDSTANTDFPVVFHDESNALLDDTAAFEYNPSSGTLIVANLDIGTDVDIDGTLETDALTIAGTAIVAQATASAVGGVELATAAEVLTGTDAARVVTADTLSAKSVVCTIAQSSLTDDLRATITHSLGTADTMVQLYDMTTEAPIYAEIGRTTDDMSTASTSVITVDFGTSPPNDVRAVITSLAGATAGSVAYT